MKTEPQNSIQQRMREILDKLKSFSPQLESSSDFEGFALSLDRLDRLIAQLSSKQSKDQEEKKESSKDIKHKTNQLKELKRDFENYKRDREISDEDFEHQITNQKNTISDLKRKLEIARETQEFHQYQKLKDQKEHLQKLVHKEEAAIISLSEEKKKMVSMIEFNSVQAELIEFKRSYSQVENWERKFNSWNNQMKELKNQLETQKLTNKHLQSIIQNQKVEIDNDTQLISSLLDEEQNTSMHSSETCESTNDYQMEDIEFQKKKKKSKKSKKYKPKEKFQVIDEAPEMAETETEELPPHQSTHSEIKSVKSFSIVMIFLASVLAIPMPGWNC